VPIRRIDGHVRRVIEGRLQLRSRRITDGPEFASCDVEREYPVSIAIDQDDLVMDSDEDAVCVSDATRPPPPTNAPVGSKTTTGGSPRWKT